MEDAQASEELFKLYPNPEQRTYQLELRESEGIAKLYDVAGRPLAQHAISAGIKTKKASTKKGEGLSKNVLDNSL